MVRDLLKDLHLSKSFCYNSAKPFACANKHSHPNAKCPNKTIRLNLSSNSGLGVGNLNTKCLSACNNLNSLSRWNGVGDPKILLVPDLNSSCNRWNLLCGEGLVVHEEKLDVGCVVDEESLVSGWHHVAGLLVGTETNLYPHQPCSIETLLCIECSRIPSQVVRECHFNHSHFQFHVPMA